MLRSATRLGALYVYRVAANAPKTGSPLLKRKVVSVAVRKGSKVTKPLPPVAASKVKNPAGRPASGRRGKVLKKSSTASKQQARIKKPAVNRAPPISVAIPHQLVD